ncbi:MAG: hemerythrin domain-containing protein [Ignavibacteriae bacterium]|nr:MAG: hemerythrin domain-containing protein [Ignavibacteriota bacterium]
MERHKSLISLSSEHHHGLVTAQKLKYGYKPSSSTDTEMTVDDKKEMLLKFSDEYIHKHFRLEEEILVPYLPDNEIIKRMLDEHVKMYELLYVIEVSDPDEALLNQYGEKLEAHIRFEERELFPLVEKSLTEEQLNEIEQKLKGENK